MIRRDDGDRTMGEDGGVGDLTLRSTRGDTGRLVCEKISFGGRLELRFSKWCGLSQVTDLGLAERDLAKSKLLNFESVTGFVCLRYTFIALIVGSEVDDLRFCNW